MRYISTRGNAPAKTFTEILLGGLAPDGGLYLPEQYPRVSAAELNAWRKLSYADLAFAVLSKFATDIPAAPMPTTRRMFDTLNTAPLRNAGRTCAQSVAWKFSRVAMPAVPIVPSVCENRMPKRNTPIA